MYNQVSWKAKYLYNVEVCFEINRCIYVNWVQLWTATYVNNSWRHTTRQILLHSSTSNNYWQLGPNLNGGAYAYRKRSNKIFRESPNFFYLTLYSKVLDELCPHTFDDKWLWWNNALFSWDSIPNLTIETDFDPG